MKKVAIGCGIVLILLAIVGGGVSWYVYHKAKSYISGFAELGKIPDIERGVTNTTAFTAPETGDLTAEQLDRYLKVQDKVRTMLGEQYTKLDAQYKELADRLNKNQGTALDMPAVTFWSRIVDRVTLLDFLHGLGKSVVFAWIIGFAARARASS